MEARRIVGGCSPNLCISHVRPTGTSAEEDMYSEWVSIRSKVSLLRAHARCLTGASTQRDPFAVDASSAPGRGAPVGDEEDGGDAGEVTWRVVTSAQAGFAPQLQWLWLALL